MIISKVTKNHGFILSLKDTFLKNHREKTTSLLSVKANEFYMIINNFQRDLILNFKDEEIADLLFQILILQFSFNCFNELLQLDLCLQLYYLFLNPDLCSLCLGNLFLLFRVLQLFDSFESWRL